ncbi:MAG: hypothetical protein WCD52_25945, partial [Xanthobacteraceae bacterium]
MKKLAAANVVLAQEKATAWTLKAFKYYYYVCRIHHLIVNIIKRSSYSRFNKAPRVGYLRGIDFYKGSELISTIALAMYEYQRFHGARPNLLKP